MQKYVLIMGQIYIEYIRSQKLCISYICDIFLRINWMIRMPNRRRIYYFWPKLYVHICSYIYFFHARFADLFRN